MLWCSSYSFLIGWNLFKYGLDLQRSGEVSPDLAVSLSIRWPMEWESAALIQCLVMVCDIVKIFGGEYE